MGYYFTNILDITTSSLSFDYINPKNKKSKKKYLKLQKGDVIKTQSSMSWSNQVIKYKPKIKPEKGIKLFLDWFRNYYKI